MSRPHKGNMRKWVAALRSGEYKQGKFGLATIGDDGDVEHCCLGVACEVSGLVPLREEEDDLRRDLYYGEAAGTLPRAVQRWLGVGGDNPFVEGDYLSAWNDHQGADFNKIADLIEAKYLTKATA